MQKIKIIVEDNQLTQAEISSKQNFDKVIKDYKKYKPTIFINPWFYGIVGLCSILFFIFVK